MSNVGYATLTIIPSAKGFAKSLSGEVDGQLDKSGESAGAGFGGAVVGKFGGVLKAGLLATGAAGAAVLGTALTKGFQRLTAIENAQAKLKGLGHDAASVQTIMDSALASVKGTAFGLGDAAGVAAGVVAAGIKPGQDLTRTLKLVGDAATIGGSSMGEMGAIFNKVAATGKIQGEVLAQLGERGIPILQLLGQEIGKTPAEVQKMASEGKIGFETFQNAMEKGLGGAALKSGETTEGALANMNAALGRLGAALLKGVFPIFKQVFGGLTGFIDVATAAVGPFLERVSGALGGLFDFWGNRDDTASLAKALGISEDSQIITVIRNVYDAVSGIIGLVQGEHPGGLFANLGIAEDSPILDVILNVRQAIVDFFGSLSSGGGAASTFSSYMAGVASIVGQLIDGVQRVIPVIAGIFAGIWAIIEPTLPRLAGIFNGIVSLIGPVMALIGQIISTAITVIVFLWQAWGDDLLRLVGVVWNAIIGVIEPIINLIRAVITTVMALLQGDWAGAWAGVQAIVSAAWSVVASVVTGALSIVWGVIKAVLGMIGSLFAGVWADITASVAASWQSIKDTIARGAATVDGAINGFLSRIGGWFSSTWSSITSTVSDAWNRLTSAVSTGVGEAVSTISGLPGRAVAALSGVGSSLFSAGQDLIRGLVNGIGAMASSVAEKAREVVSGAVNAAKEALGIHSPSRVFMEIGHYTGEGLALGIEREARRVQDATNSLVPAAPAFGSPDFGTSDRSGLAASGLRSLIENVHLGGNGSTTSDDIDELVFKLRNITRGGVYAIA